MKTTAAEAPTDVAHAVVLEERNRLESPTHASFGLWSLATTAVNRVVSLRRILRPQVMMLMIDTERLLKPVEINQLQRTPYSNTIHDTIRVLRCSQ